MVNIRKRICLQPFILCFAKFRAEALSCQGREACASYPKYQGKNRTDSHLYAFCIDVLSVPTCHTHIYQICHDNWNDQFKDRFRSDTEYRQNRIYLILMHIRKILLNIPHLHTIVVSAIIVCSIIQDVNPDFP